MRRALCALAACSIPSTDVPGEQVLRGEHVVVHADPQLPICEAAIADADAYLADVASYLGAALPDVTYVVHDRRDDSCGFGSAYIADCTAGHTIFAYNWISYRELANAVVWDWGHPPALFSEGLGGALAGPPTKPVDRATADVASIAATTSFFAGTPDQVTSHFDVANDFITFLMQRDGVAKMRALSQQLVYLSDPLTIDQTFDHVFGETLAQAIAAWRTDAPLAGALPLDTLACTAPAVAADATGTFAMTEPGCARGETAAGGKLTQPVMHTVDVGAPGLYLVQTTSQNAVDVVVRGCGAANERFPADLTLHAAAGQFGAESWLLPFAAGTHALALDTYEHPVEGAVVSTLTWSASPVGAESADCATAPSLALAAPSFLHFAASPSGDSWLRVDPSATSQLFIDCRAGTAQCPPNTAQLCNGCGAGATCNELTTGRSWGNAPLWLHLVGGTDLVEVTFDAS